MIGIQVRDEMERRDTVLIRRFPPRIYMSSDWIGRNCDSTMSTTCRQFHEVSILFEQNSEFHLHCIRLLLWDCDNRSYSYYIETSYDNITWSKAVDKQSVACK